MAHQAPDIKLCTPGSGRGEVKPCIVKNKKLFELIKKFRL